MSDTAPEVEAADSGAWWQRHARRNWMAIRVALALLAVLAGAWWLRFSPLAVTTYSVATGTVEAEVMGTGTLEARTSAIVGPKIGGLILRITVDEGDLVQAGDLLIQLEASDLEQQVGIAQSESAAAAAALDRLEADQRRAEAVLARARTDHLRMAELTSSKVMSQQDLDKAREALSIAEAELSIAGVAIIEGRKRLDSVERSLDYQRARLQDTTIEAPFDGLVVRRDREPGDVVAPGASVLQVVSTAEMWISAWVDETELARLERDQPARVVFRSEPENEYAGTVARVGREVDRETREIVVDVRVQALPANWAVGQRAEAYIRVAREEGVTTLPAGLVLLQEGRTGVLVVEGGKARWRGIEVGLRGRENLEVASGLAPGDVVVNTVDARSGRLRDGRRITAR